MSFAADHHIGLRSRLVDALVRQGTVRSAAVERALRDVPRHAFVPDVPAAQAYEDRATPLTAPSGEPVSSLSAPTWVAAVLEELTLSPGMNVLEVGGGTGYHAALVASVVGQTGRVVTVEIERWLAERARSSLAELGFDQVKVMEGDGASFVSEDAPFDRIFLTTGTWELFPTWLAQLSMGGRLVAPLRFGPDASACLLVSLARTSDHLAGRAVMGSEMVPMRGEAGQVATTEETKAGRNWKPSSPADLRSVQVYPRSAGIEPAADEKLFVRRTCLILLERTPERW
jgi:protein-L-isoaspartate(D-aspartate) O-methyltransferase